MKPPIIRDAYDLQNASRDCKGVESEVAIAWMENGWLKWRCEGGVSAHPLIPAKKRRFLRCLVCNAGDGHRVWDAETVRRRLINHRRTRPNNGWDWIPLEDTIFDPDTSQSVWAKGADETPTVVKQRCLDFARKIMLEVKHLRQHYRETSGGVTTHLKGRRIISQKLRECIAAAKRLRDHIKLLVFPKETPNGATGLQQGIRIGTWLAEVRALIDNARLLKMGARIGKGKAQGKFWRFVMTNPEFSPKSPGEVLILLDGKEDPEFSGKKMKLVDGGLRRGNNEVLSDASFATLLSRNRNRQG